MKKIFDEFLVFALSFVVFFIGARLLFDDFKINNLQITLILLLAFANIAIRNWLIRLQQAKNIRNREFELIRRLVFICFIGIYFFIYKRLA
ncbi:hypothetical protein SAMN02745945_01622 [Peptoclostridium litorale DSM 5388]|uniref:Uncharacterized protein n=1 Tax=Peptoclostridium litorale DSM 5388 TaxID=1121324 RepID=A0A069RGJ0_PEPLI|nr:hypothetical protein [Peptoclostridium litorale]KDR96101.1 hypothetical protein CLIT_5c01130 [Peptoclostridium litorale DSM 5388]SIO04645.1 hypothetical protein SAMN02745945_01622 [Peptoclostridium litorale DSM 5388]